MDNDPLVIVIKDNYRLVKRRTEHSDANITIQFSEKYNDIKMPNSYEHYFDDYMSAFLESNLKEHINGRSYSILNRHLSNNLLTLSHDESRSYSAYLEGYNNGIKMLEQHDGIMK